MMKKEKRKNNKNFFLKIRKNKKIKLFKLCKSLHASSNAIKSNVILIDNQAICSLVFLLIMIFDDVIIKGIELSKIKLSFGSLS